MALTATIHTFDIDLADADRHVYETLALKVARHPSESEERQILEHHHAAPALACSKTPPSRPFPTAC